jgi:hypothetical protein
MGSISAEEGTTSKDAKALIKGKEVQFVDKEGKTTGKISLESDTNIITRKQIIGGVEKNQKYKQIVYKHAIASENGKYIAIIEDAGDRAFIDEEQKEHLLYEGETTGKVKLYDAQGKMLFEKQLPKGRGTSGKEVVAENGEAFAVNTFDTIRETNEPRNIVFVFDKNGQVILTIPSKEDGKKYNVYELEKISANGKYLAVSLSSGTRFYNLKNGKFWDALREYNVKEIRNDGIIEAYYRNPAIKETDSYEKRVKEGILKENPIDLNKYIGD